MSERSECAHARIQDVCQSCVSGIELTLIIAVVAIETVIAWQYPSEYMAEEPCMRPTKPIFRVSVMPVSVYVSLLRASHEGAEVGLQNKLVIVSSVQRISGSQAQVFTTVACTNCSSLQRL